MMPGLLGIPQMPPVNGGLLQRVIWDKLRQTQGLLGTEMGVRPYAGGGRGQTELPLQGGEGRSRNVRLSTPEPPPAPKFNWEPNVIGDLSADTPSGVRVIMGNSGQGRVSVQFFDPKAPVYRRWAPVQQGKASTKRSIERYSDVADAVKDYVEKFKPTLLEFSPGNAPSYQKLYDRVAPKLAKHLGGELLTDPRAPGSYHIWLGE